MEFHLHCEDGWLSITIIFSTSLQVSRSAEAALLCLSTEAEASGCSCPSGLEALPLTLLQLLLVERNERANEQYLLSCASAT